MGFRAQSVQSGRSLLSRFLWAAKWDADKMSSLRQGIQPSAGTQSSVSTVPCRKLSGSLTGSTLVPLKKAQQVCGLEEVALKHTKPVHKDWNEQKPGNFAAHCQSRPAAQKCLRSLQSPGYRDIPPWRQAIAPWALNEYVWKCETSVNVVWSWTWLQLCILVYRARGVNIIMFWRWKLFGDQKGPIATLNAATSRLLLIPKLLPKFSQPYQSLFCSWAISCSSFRSMRANPRAPAMPLWKPSFIR